MKAIIPFKFFIQWENHTIPQSQEQELWGSRTILWKVQELLPWNKLIFWTDKGERCSKSPEQPYSILNLTLCHYLRVKMATGANIKQGNSRGSSTIFLHLQGIGSSCPCRGSTLLQTSARTTYHSSISANFKTKWGKRELLAASSISFLIKLYCLRKGDRTELAHVPHSSSSDGWQDLSKDSEWGFPHRWMSQTHLPPGLCCLNVGIKQVKEQQLLHQFCLTGNFPATLSLMQEPLQPLWVTQHLEICQAEGESGALFCRDLHKAKSRGSHVPQPAAKCELHSDPSLNLPGFLNSTSCHSRYRQWMVIPLLKLPSWFQQSKTKNVRDWVYFQFRFK